MAFPDDAQGLRGGLHPKKWGFQQALMGGAPIGAAQARPRPAQQAPQTAPGFNEQNFNFGGMPGLMGLGAWGNQPQQQSPYLGAASRYADASEFGAAVGGNVAMAGMPYGLAAALAGPTAQMGVAGTQGVTAQNLSQMNNEAQMNRLQQLLSAVQPMLQQSASPLGGIQTDYGAGFSTGAPRVPKGVAMYQQGGSRG